MRNSIRRTRTHHGTPWHGKGKTNDVRQTRIIMEKQAKIYIAGAQRIGRICYLEEFAGQRIHKPDRTLAPRTRSIRRCCCASILRWRATRIRISCSRFRWRVLWRTAFTVPTSFIRIFRYSKTSLAKASSTTWKSYYSLAVPVFIHEMPNSRWTKRCFLASALEYTNEPYAIAKIAGLKMCESFNLQYGTNYIAVMPTNLYGPNDNFDLERSHVLPADDTQSTSGPLSEREQLGSLTRGYEPPPGRRSRRQCFWWSNTCYLKKIRDQCNRSDSLGAPEPHYASSFGAKRWQTPAYLWWSMLTSKTPTGLAQKIYATATSTSEPARRSVFKHWPDLIIRTVGYQGTLTFDSTKPDGTMRKLTDPSKLHSLGWHHQIEIEEGVQRMYDWYLS